MNDSELENLYVVMDVRWEWNLKINNYSWMECVVFCEMQITYLANLITLDSCGRFENVVLR